MTSTTGLPDGVGLAVDTGRFRVHLGDQVMGGSGDFFYADVDADEATHLVGDYPVYVHFDMFDEDSWLKPTVTAGFAENEVSVTRISYEAKDHAEFSLDEDSLPNYPLEEPLPNLKVEVLGFDIATDGGEIEVCPNCDSSRISSQANTERNGAPSGAEYLCRDCSGHFDEPATREPKHGANTLHGLAAELDSASADDLATDGGKAEIPDGHLEAARSAGAHDEFIAFVAEYPESDAAETLETAISLNALDDFQGFAGSFLGSLWEHGAKKSGNPDTENGKRIRELFPEDRWPEWMQQEYGGKEVRADGSGEVTGDEIIGYITDREQDDDLRRDLKQTIYNSEDGKGAPVGEVVESTVGLASEYHLMDVTLAIYALAQSGEVYAPTSTTLRLVDQYEDESEIRADGGGVDVDDEDVEHYPDGFHSGTHYLDDGGHHGPDPGDPMQWCHECGNERGGMCGVCGVPLCHRHLETGAGFCSDRVSVDTRVGVVSACIRTTSYERTVAVDAPAFNYERPQRARLSPATLERAVRDRLPHALVERAADAVGDALESARESYPEKKAVHRLLELEDTLEIALAASGDRQAAWLRTAALQCNGLLESLEEDKIGIGMDLARTERYLDQLGYDGPGGEDR